MQDLKFMIDTCQNLAEENERVVLATVVAVTGSAYRRPGARMIILEDGRTLGTISGGCL